MNPLDPASPARLLALSAALLLAPAITRAAEVRGQLVVVEDSANTAHTGFSQLPLNVCQFGAQGLYTVRGDVFDAVVAFTTHPLVGIQYIASTTPTGYMVKAPDTGVVYGSALVQRPPSAYGSAGALQHCIYMGPLASAPASPETEYKLGLKAIEVLGHEFGHRWLLLAAYDKNDGQGPQAQLRANLRDNPEADPFSSSTLHYSTLVDSHSVMLGSFITDQGNGSFTVAGGVRKYGALDQYLMGLRSPSETPPTLLIDDGSHIGLYEEPLRPGESTTKTGTAVMVSVDDVVRAQGARVPAYPNAQNCWRVAFVLVTHQGHTATTDELAKVDAYRVAWENWFRFATDGRGATNTDLDASSCGSPANDGGTPIVDAGNTPDAGTIATSDGGTSVPDSGTTQGRDASVVTSHDASAGSADASDNSVDDDGCACHAGGGSSPAGWLLFALLVGAGRGRSAVSKRHRRQ